MTKAIDLKFILQTRGDMYFTLVDQNLEILL